MRRKREPLGIRWPKILSSTAVSFLLPSPPSRVMCIWHTTESVSYRNMCRFNSGFFYRHPLLQKYRWYWRIEYVHPCLSSYLGPSLVVFAPADRVPTSPAISTSIPSSTWKHTTRPTVCITTICIPTSAIQTQCC